MYCVSVVCHNCGRDFVKYTERYNEAIKFGWNFYMILFNVCILSYYEFFYDDRR